MIRRHAVVTGVVQGVSFRWFTAREAARLGLTGWVRNRPDGSVELEVQGGDEAVAVLLEAVTEGPPHALVRSVTVTDREPIVGEQEFGLTW